jgi:hypothetical protein
MCIMPHVIVNIIIGVNSFSSHALCPLVDAVFFELCNAGTVKGIET